MSPLPINFLGFGKNLSSLPSQVAIYAGTFPPAALICLLKILLSISCYIPIIVLGLLPLSEYNAIK
jgi:hypothetical protein